MRLLVALSVMAAAYALTISTAAAQSYAFCLKGCDFGAGDCSFASYQQCQASASGREAWCAPNPYFRPVSDPKQSGRSHLSRRRL
jgi:Protein of unknown function (DUF3551)